MTLSEYLQLENSQSTLLVRIYLSTGFFFSDKPYITEPTDSLPNQPFAPIIVQGGIPEFKRSIQELTGGRSVRSYGTLELATHLYELWDLPTVNFRNAEIEIRIAGPQPQFSYDDSLLWFKGIIGGSSGDDSQSLTLELTDKQTQLQSVILPNQTYDSAAMGASFPADNDGIPIPMVRGFAARVPGTLIDKANLTYQFSDRSLAITSVYDNGQLLKIESDVVSAVQGTNQIEFNTWAAGVDDIYNGCWLSIYDNFNKVTTIESKQIIDYDGATRTATVDSNLANSGHDTVSLNLYKTDAANSTSDGTIELIAPNAGLVTADVSDSIQSGGDFIKDLLLEFTNIPTTDIDIDMPNYTGGFYLAEQMTLENLITMLIRGHFSYFGFDDNQFIAKKIFGPSFIITPDHTISVNDILGRIQWQEHSDITWSVTTKRNRNWSNAISNNQGSRDAKWLGETTEFNAPTNTLYPDAISQTLEQYGIDGNVESAGGRLLDMFGSKRHEITIELPFTGVAYKEAQSVQIEDASSFLNKTFIILSAKQTRNRKIQLECIG